MEPYHDLPDCITRLRFINCSEPFFSVVSSVMRLKPNCITQGLTVLEQNLNVMYIFTYDGNEWRLQWKWKSKDQMGRELDKVTLSFFPDPKLITALAAKLL